MMDKINNLSLESVDISIAENVCHRYTDYLLFFFLLLVELWGGVFKKNSLLFFYLLLTKYSL
ncbi:hypothetical protein [Caloranaerobacter azorensis]|uniref:Uncharacterized protein n=1 Tax=Caloranaerobacter azorensis TaxID=116090 RepID=A0A6P1YD65_9FIRM|nr:hypothetical protein [Caloranaerobacter azorensis]QIB26663.1 hypothetical protein G3A45_04705 [Caloranaerobacter azorensis]